MARERRSGCALSGLLIGRPSPRQQRCEVGDLVHHFLDQRRDALAANGQTLFRGKSIDLALDVEDRVDALDRLQSERRDRGLLAKRLIARIGGDVREHEELAPPVAPARGFHDRPRGPARRIEPVEAGA